MDLKKAITKIDNIAKQLLNTEQKSLAKTILKNSCKNGEVDDKILQFILPIIKTGFVFDKAPEVDQDNIAVIQESKNYRKIGTNGPCHNLIIGENYEVLKNLRLVFSKLDSGERIGLIDVIYIDPPYNTQRSKDEGNDYKEEVSSSGKFIYRDKYKRTGWLNMMDERLRLAKDLLTEDGVIFISIDDSECAYLKVLCDEIFHEDNFISCLTWHSSNTVLKPGKNIRKDHEYILVYSKDITKTAFNKLKGSMDFFNIDNDPKGPWFSANAAPGIGKEEFPITLPNGSVVVRRWGFTKEEYENGSVNLYFKGNNVPRIKVYKSEYIQNKTPSSIISSDIGGTLTTAKNDLKKLYISFDTPKPVKLIKYLLSISTKKSSLVLDFFAGSGTTGQAVMELNEEDGGNRRFILVTNNENNIAKDITYERLYRLINNKAFNNPEITNINIKKWLNNNQVDIFEINHYLCTIDKDPEKLKKLVISELKKLNEDVKFEDLRLNRDLSSLFPYDKSKLNKNEIKDLNKF
ncbi:site-specific DNA-methyltransferase [Mycoplasma sp. SG1]|uniref:site-specific DNA-methyltransferase n=1 Tax=Mycoplasma sp. SG1 TaxID=2810348 RepID=UPI00202585D0|nr:site-specific DNA-methyltransferase [Mycoplasma sp. SG1]URM52995.1 site-specific DNA-methyltransferase [Mycoplasma sp. SG1]